MHGVFKLHASFNSILCHAGLGSLGRGCFIGSTKTRRSPYLANGLSYEKLDQVLYTLAVPVQYTVVHCSCWPVKVVTNHFIGNAAQSILNVPHVTICHIASAELTKSKQMGFRKSNTFIQIFRNTKNSLSKRIAKNIKQWSKACFRIVSSGVNLLSKHRCQTSVEVPQNPGNKETLLCLYTLVLRTAWIYLKIL